jgi:hypothetical protein
MHLLMLCVCACQGLHRCLLAEGAGQAAGRNAAAQGKRVLAPGRCLSLTQLPTSAAPLHHESGIGRRCSRSRRPGAPPHALSGRPCVTRAHGDSVWPRSRHTARLSVRRLPSRAPVVPGPALLVGARAPWRARTDDWCSLPPRRYTGRIDRGNLQRRGHTGTQRTPSARGVAHGRMLQSLEQKWTLPKPVAPTPVAAAPYAEARCSTRPAAVHCCHTRSASDEAVPFDPDAPFVPHFKSQMVRDCCRSQSGLTLAHRSKRSAP